MSVDRDVSPIRLAMNGRTPIVFVIAYDIATPTRPPAKVIATPSSRNCTRMCRRRAPIALRTPISRVRSCTETSMMFITPTPPIISVSDPMNTSTTISPLAMPSTIAIVSALVSARTARSSRASNRSRAASVSRTCRSATSCDDGSTAW